MQSTQAEITNLLKARYKLLYIVTWEEERCKEMIQDIVTEKFNGMDMYSWDLAGGLEKLTGDDAKVVEPQMDPEGVLQHIKAANGRAVYLLKDFHSFLTDAGVTRALRNVVNEETNEKYTPVIITSPVMKIPVELEKGAQVLDFDMPTFEQIVLFVEEAIASIKIKNPKYDLSLDEREKLARACQGLTVDEISNILSKSLVESNTLEVDLVLGEKKQIIRKSGVLEYYDNLEEFANVGGMDLLKDWLAVRGQSFTRKARDFGLPQPKGVLLLGTQGCGKTLICKAIAGLWKMPIIRLDVGRVMHGIVGSSEENMRKAIRVAENIAPCILFVDEIEKGLSGTGSSNFSDGGTTSRVFSTLLTWLQDKTAPVFVIATANDVRGLPPELLRKGRFDSIFFITLPSKEERIEILRIHLTKKGRDTDKFDLEALADLSDGFSGAELEQAILDSMYDAFAKGEDIDQGYLVSSITVAVPLSMTMKERLDGDRAWARTNAMFASSYEKHLAAADKTKANKQKPFQVKPSKFRVTD